MNNKDYPHYDAILSIFEPYFHDCMNEEDRETFVVWMLSKAGRTFKDLNDEIEIGVNNGHSVAFQLKLIRALIKFEDVTDNAI